MLYFHIPFCRKKCPYCHFYVLPNREKERALYLKGLEKEWSLKKERIQKPLSSIYFGGGTPSLFPEAIERVLSWISIEGHEEITVECNPEDLSFELLQRLKKAGVNRISLGVQSFDQEDLIAIGRKEPSLIEMASSVIGNISIDLMYDIPTQTPERFEKTLQKALSSPITHISLYNLTIEPHTLFAKTKPKQPSDEESLAMLESAVAMLSKGGFERYEISAFAKKGYQAVHNKGYWQGKPFLGFGPSAFSYEGGVRYQNHPHLLRYVNASSEEEMISFSEKLEGDHKQKELLGIELRLLEGVDLTIFEEKRGPLSPSLRKALSHLIEEDFLVQKERLQLTEKGLLFYDEAMSLLLNF